MSKRAVVVALTVLVVGSLAGWFIAKTYLLHEEKSAVTEQETNHTARTEWTQEAVTVKVGVPSGDGISYEERKVRYDSTKIRMAELIVEEYLKALPTNLRETKLLGLYQDRDNVLYVDLSEEFRKNFSGDARLEFYLLKSLLETLTLNVEGTQDVKILLEGKEVDTVGGHFQVLYPLRDWLTDRTAQPG